MKWHCGSPAQWGWIFSLCTTRVPSFTEILRNCSTRKHGQLSFGFFISGALLHSCRGGKGTRVLCLLQRLIWGAGSLGGQVLACLYSTDQVLRLLYLNTPVSNALYHDKDASQHVTSGALMLGMQWEQAWMQYSKAAGSAERYLVGGCADEAQTVTRPSWMTLWGPCSPYAPGHWLKGRQICLSEKILCGAGSMGKLLGHSWCSGVSASALRERIISASVLSCWDLMETDGKAELLPQQLLI